jgi:hypothetical protein
MRAMRSHLLALLPLAACGGGDDPSPDPYLGMYMVTSHRLNTGGPFPCTDAGTELGTPAYIHLIFDEDFRDVQMEDCTSADPSSCTFAFFSADVAEDGLFSENGSAQPDSSGGTFCQLSAFRDEGSLDGTMLHLASFRWYESVDLSPSECTFERAEELLGGPMCEEVETWDATKL